MILASAASAAAILGGVQLGATATADLSATTASDGATDGATTGSSSGTGTTGVSGTDAADSSAAAGSATSVSEAASATTSAADGTYTGSAVSTRWGDVQVQVTISGGTIAEVTALQLTDHDGRSIQISNRAEPVLRSEVLQAQSASVAMVSGATYTSAAYLQSLQSALDQAGF
jgi:uncharacterized protein with FMN-binding domain